MLVFLPIKLIIIDLYQKNQTFQLKDIPTSILYIMKDQIVEIMKSVNQPISERNLAKRLNTTYKHIKYICNSNPDTFQRAHPLEVGSNKYDNTRDRSFSKINKCRRPLHIWKLA